MASLTLRRPRIIVLVSILIAFGFSQSVGYIFIVRAYFHSMLLESTSEALDTPQHKSPSSRPSLQKFLHTNISTAGMSHNEEQQERNNRVASFGIVTALSDNHATESVHFFQNLVKVNYQGPVWIHFLTFTTGTTKVDSTITNRLKHLKLLVDESPLNATFAIYNDTDGAHTYCWKPKIIQGVIDENELDVVMWADVSTRFDDNPQTAANHILTDGIDFSGRTSVMGMGENTHEDIYQWFRLNRSDFRNFKEVVATQFIVNVRRPSVASLLQEWFSCSDACLQCMAPLGSTKDFGSKQPKGPPSTIYLAHRQDQSVLGVLVYRLKQNMTARSKISLSQRSVYFQMRTQRLKGKARAPIGVYWNSTAASFEECLNANDGQHVKWYDCFSSS